VENDIFYSKEDEKAIEIYFREKEAEKVRKRKMDEDIQNEEEKKKKKFNDGGLPAIVFDAEGNFMKVKYPDPEKFVNLADSKFVVRTEAEMKLYREKMKLKDPYQLIPKRRTTILDRRLLEKPYRIYLTDEKVEEPVPELNFQPDPLRSVILSQGVNMTFYNNKKKGEKFKNPNKIDNKEFNELLYQYRPKYTMIKSKVDSINDEKQISEKAEECNSFHSNKFSNVYMILSTEEDTFEQKGSPRGLEEKFSTFLETGDKLIKHRIKKRNIPWKNDKGGTYDKIIRTDTNLRLETIDLLDNELIYQNIVMGDDPRKFSRNTKKIDAIAPKSTHGDIFQELGKLTKYPRERMSREVLISTGKISLQPDSSRKNRKK
jgi:hypothetical protein